MNSLNSIRKGGHSGKALVPHDPENSLIVKFIKTGRMPPPSNKPMADDEIRLVVDWIRQGAE